jgi:hypothetical protein
VQPATGQEPAGAGGVPGGGGGEGGRWPGGGEGTGPLKHCDGLVAGCEGVPEVGAPPGHSVQDGRAPFSFFPGDHSPGFAFEQGSQVPLEVYPHPGRQTAKRTGLAELACAGRNQIVCC